MDRTGCVNIPLDEGHVRAIRWAIKATIGAASAQEDMPPEERMEVIARMSVLDEYIVSNFREASGRSLEDLAPTSEQLHLDL